MRRVAILILLAVLAVSATPRATVLAQTPAATIDATQQGEPIDKFIYAQFIEHLGRCIYGGIWAEMLEDRKFFFEITPEYDPYRASRGVAKDALLPVVGASPWEIVGEGNSVTMVTEDSFVGEQTPLIQPGSGIRQNDLGLVEGKQYVGYIWLKAADAPATVTVSLTNSGGEATFSVSGSEYAKYPLMFTTGDATDEGSLSIFVMEGACSVGTASLMPIDNIDGMRADTLALLKQLNAPMYRWPGGNFVSGYDWRDGIGDRDRRPPRQNPAWTGVEHNDVGVDEFVAFCRAVDAEPLIAVNTGFGDAYSAAQEVEYTNGSTDTIGGRWRAENGNPEPYNITWWCVGNEMWGPWQLGYMQLKHYTQKHNQVAEYMLKADPEIKLIGAGDLMARDKMDPKDTRGFSEGLLLECADTMDLISEHFYCRGELADIPAHIAQVTDRIKEKADAHREYRRTMPHLANHDIRIAMDEWNYWFRPYVYGELGCIYRLRDALGIAAGIHEFARNSDIISMAHYAQTVNVIGCIKTTKTDATLATTALPLMLYRNQFGTIPVEVGGNCAELKIDVVAALTEDGSALTIGVVNPLYRPQSISVDIAGVQLGPGGTVWTIAGDQVDPLLYNEPGKEPTVAIQETKFDHVPSVLEVPGLSASVFRIEIEK